MTSFRSSGDHAVVRYIWFDKISHARPVTVVRDDDELIATYLAPRTMCKACNPPGQRETYNDVLLAKSWELLDIPWRWNRVLMLVPPGEWYSVWGIWPDGDDGEPSCWYVNLEIPTQRSHAGYDTRDLQLDVVLWPDGRCEWKDEDDFFDMCRLGLISTEEQRMVRATGEAVIAAAERGDCWWREWDGWTPDPSWDLPVFAPGWDRVVG